MHNFLILCRLHYVGWLQAMKYWALETQITPGLKPPLNATSGEQFKPQDRIAQDGNMSLVLYCLIFPFCKGEAGLHLWPYRNYNLDVWMTASSVLISYASLHQTLIISCHRLMTHYKANPCRGTRGQHLTTAGNFREGASFGANRRIILGFATDAAMRVGCRQGVNPGEMEGWERGVHTWGAWLPWQRGDSGRGDKRVKLCCEELSKTGVCLSWVQGSSISHLHRKFTHF